MSGRTQKIQEKRDVYLKLTRHNGRAGTHGTYNPKHNDRSFNLANSEHIDPERAKGNIYWDCFHGFRSALDPQDPDDLAATFSDVERQFYETHYTAFIESQNERNAKIRHTERNRSIPDLLSSRKTCPEETIYQLGTLDEHASAEDLLSVVTEFIEKFKAKYGDHVHVLDWALHLDESTPHIHERHVFDCENKYGEVAPQQEKALEALGFELPDPDKPLSRRNNRKITFDAACRKMLFEIAKRHGLELEEEAEYGNRKYLEKQDFILAKQKEQLAAQQSKLDELTLKVSDMETLLENVLTFYGHWRTAESGEGSPDGGDGFGTLLVGVAVVGVAGVVAYQVGTELILDQLLPAGVAVPHTRAELAMFLWNTAGRPAPATLPAFADVADPELAQAAQWAIEQGYLKARADGSFKPDKGVAKWRVIRGYRAVTEP